MKLRSMIVARGWRHVLTKRHDAVTEAMKTRLEIARRKPDALPARVLYTTGFFWEGSYDLLPVTVDPASEHGDEHVQDHRCATGWKQRRHDAVQSTSNPRYFN